MHYAGLPHNSVPDGGRGCERRCVRVDGARARGSNAALPDDNGLPAGRSAQNVEEEAAVLGAFHVHSDNLSLGVVRQVLDVVRRVQDDSVAEADRLRAFDAPQRPNEREVDTVRSAL